MRRLLSRSPPTLESLLRSELEIAAAESNYWMVDCYYAFDGDAVERTLIPTVRDLWEMCLEFVDKAVRDDEILLSLGIPRHAWSGIAESWHSKAPAPLARFDLSFDGLRPPRLHECNIDVVGLLYEATLFQRAWMDHHRDRDTDFAGYGQFAEVEAGLASAFASEVAGSPVRLLSISPSPYEELWIASISQILEGRGIACELESFASLEELLEAEGDLDASAPARLSVKAFRWDLLLPHAEWIRKLTSGRARLISPLWSLVLSSKGCLPWLWRMNRGHPNLLEACFHADQIASSNGFVSKPLFSIQGQNVALSDKQEPSRNLVTGGAALGARRIYQELCYLPRFDVEGHDRWTSTGAWVANGKPAGISITEANSPLITDENIRYAPHVLR